MRNGKSCIRQYGALLRLTAASQASPDVMQDHAGEKFDAVTAGYTPAGQKIQRPMQWKFLLGILLNKTMKTDNQDCILNLPEKSTFSENY
ncbi:MAG: hypothetical protein H6851_07445 [Geminicoccaceae bacterium]|nr:hypothetical protein [Geminicoccaceae bacterium]